MLSQTTEYALRAATHLASIYPRACTTSALSQATSVPSAYLAKILLALTKAGFVHSQRGVGGGVGLKSSPQELTLLEIANAIDPIQRITTCPLGLAGHGKRLCPLHRSLDNSIAEVQKHLGSTTLAAVLKPGKTSTPLCERAEKSARDRG